MFVLSDIVPLLDMDNENDLVRDIKRERNQSIQFKRGRDVNQEGYTVQWNGGVKKTCLGEYD